jgi:hypothetical protein
MPGTDAGTTSRDAAPIGLPDATRDAPRFDAFGDTGLPSGLGPFAFRRGVNPGYYGAGIDRRESAMLSAGAGVTSLRTPLPESYLARWGDTVEVADWAFYQTLGLGNHVVFLIGPSADHSTAPSGTPDWELDHFAPSQLDAPIFLADGSVNPDNHWASYVARVAQNYGDDIAIYEVWNEPDQVLGNWRVTEEWDTRAPLASELPWWNASIYAYVRALRIAHEVIHRIDPDAMVTVGGVGYPNFLRAVLRYTDEPTAGAVDAAHPSPGSAYLDCLSFHYYPVFGGGSSDRGVDGLLEAASEMRGVLGEAGITNMPLVVTESGAPRVAVGTTPGSPTYAAAYLLKAMTLGHYEGFLGIDWFAQGETASRQSTDSFESMGLYFDYGMASTPADVRRSPQGDAYAWLATWMEDTAADPASLTALALPSNVRGAAFRRHDGSRAYVLWARTTGDESATASFALAAASEVRVRTFAVESGPTDAMRVPEGGNITLALTTMPTVIDIP